MDYLDNPQKYLTTHSSTLFGEGFNKTFVLQGETE